MVTTLPYPGIECVALDYIHVVKTYRYYTNMVWFHRIAKRNCCWCVGKVLYSTQRSNALYPIIIRISNKISDTEEKNPDESYVIAGVYEFGDRWPDRHPTRDQLAYRQLIVMTIDR